MSELGHALSDSIVKQPDPASLLELRRARALNFRHASSPRLLTSGYGTRRPCCSVARRSRDVRNDWVKSRTRGARLPGSPTCHASSRTPGLTKPGLRAPICRFTAAPGVGSSESVHGALAEPGLGSSFHLRSARGWILSACCMPPGIAAFVDTCLVRTDCRPDMHLDRPPVWSASTLRLHVSPAFHR